MLLLLQAAHLPNGAPIYITVAPPPEGLPDWAKITIGALIAVLTSLVVEMAKPSITRSLARRAARKELLAELRFNVEAFVGVYAVISRLCDVLLTLSELEKRAAVTFARLFAFNVSHERFDYYGSEQKQVLYDLPFYPDLRNMYHLAGFYNSSSENGSDVESTNYSLKEILESGQAVLKANHILAPTPNESQESQYRVFVELERRKEQDRPKQA